MSRTVLPRTFTDDARITHSQWPTDGRYGVVMACGAHLRPMDEWNRVRRPVTCFVCLVKSR